MTSDRDRTLAIRRILDEHGQLSVQARSIRNSDNLFARGLTPLAAVDVLLAIEAAFGVLFPSSMMARSSVASIDAILSCLRTLQARPLAA